MKKTNPNLRSNMLKALLLFVFFVSFHISLISQNIGINTTGAAANSSALLDVGDGNAATGGDTKGLLIPRVALISNTDVATVPAPATSLMVYNTNATMTNGNGTGYYYWDGAKWVTVVTTSVPGGCADACAWTLAAVANSTIGGTGNISSGYTVPAGKEVLVVAIENSVSFTFAMGDNPAVYETLNDGGNNYSVSLNCPLGSYGVLNTSAYSVAKIRGRKANASAATMSITGYTSDFISASIDGTGLIYLVDGSSSSDAGMYVFER